jgi:predicted RNase H-like HicB family nuclease
MKMTRLYSAIVKREGDGFVSHCPQLGVTSQGDTVEDARGNLEEAVALFLETASASEVKSRLDQYEKNVPANSLSMRRRASRSATRAARLLEHLASHRVGGEVDEQVRADAERLLRRLGSARRSGLCQGVALTPYIECLLKAPLPFEPRDLYLAAIKVPAHG